MGAPSAGRPLFLLSSGWADSVERSSERRPIAASRRMGRAYSAPVSTGYLPRRR